MPLFLEKPQLEAFRQGTARAQIEGDLADHVEALTGTHPDLDLSGPAPDAPPPPPSAEDELAAHVQSLTASIPPTRDDWNQQPTPAPDQGTAPSAASAGDDLAQHVQSLLASGGPSLTRDEELYPSQSTQPVPAQSAQSSDAHQELAQHVVKLTGGYTVQPGDTLSAIAQRFLGDPNAYDTIAAANNISDPNAITPGQTLDVNLPAPARTPPTGEDIRDVRAAGGRAYTIQPGDTLSGISARMLGNANRYGEIASASGVDNPDLIRPGQRLVIPGQDQGAAPASGAPVAVTPATGVGVVNAKEGRGYSNQFQLGLSDADAYAACGPAAAIAFAQANGRNPTIQEAMTLARQSGWSQQTGMRGVASEQQLLQAMGVGTTLETKIDWSHVLFSDD